MAKVSFLLKKGTNYWADTAHKTTKQHCDLKLSSSWINIYIKGKLENQQEKCFEKGLQKNWLSRFFPLVVSMCFGQFWLADASYCTEATWSLKSLTTPAQQRRWHARVVMLAGTHPSTCSATATAAPFLWQSTKTGHALAAVGSHLASMSGSWLWMNSCMHWCSVERSRNSLKDLRYRSSS